MDVRTIPYSEIEAVDQWDADAIASVVAGRLEDERPRTVAELEAAYQRDEFNAWNAQEAALACEIDPPDQLALAAPELLDWSTSRRQQAFTYRYLLHAIRQNHAATWKPQFQNRGTCVGQAGKLAADSCLAVNHLVFGRVWPGPACVAGMYAGSRVDVAGRPGRWDGSNGSWLAKWATSRGGVLLMSDINLPWQTLAADERLAVAWTASRAGVPTAREEEAKDNPITRAPLVTTFEEAAAAIENLGVVVNCSNLIPSGRRDRHGFSPVRRSGGHATVFWAVRRNPDGLLYENSWSGEWASANWEWRFPDDQPPGAVWVDRNDSDAILRQRDSYAFFGVGGFAPLADNPYPL